MRQWEQAGIGGGDSMSVSMSLSYPRQGGVSDVKHASCALGMQEEKYF